MQYTGFISRAKINVSLLTPEKPDLIKWDTQVKVLSFVVRLHKTHIALLKGLGWAVKQIKMSYILYHISGAQTPIYPADIMHKQF